VRRSALTILACAAILLPAAARGSGDGGLRGSPLLWATVDACESSASGGALVGLRASMPGTGNPNVQMYMIFRLQYRVASGRWAYLHGADSGLVDVGSAQFRTRQGGIDFHLAAGALSGRVVRGAVDFEWRRGVAAVSFARTVTSAGHHPGAGASPPGFSVAHCTVS